MTANAAYELHAEHDVGSLEVGKLADFIVLDRNVFRIPARQISDVKGSAHGGRRTSRVRRRAVPLSAFAPHSSGPPRTASRAAAS